MANKTERILFVVHPGSGCGSADMTLGRHDAEAARKALAEDILAWEGGIVVIDGALSDELDHPKYRVVGRALQDALSGAEARGDIAVRIMGDDDSDRNQVRAAGHITQRYGLAPETHTIALTGCWYRRDGTSGCVTSVKDALEARGFSVEVLGGAVCEPDDVPENDTYRP